ncbi:hypothetical protein Ddye_000610 [Dipteronia dyeriana]|uniref:Uncharacterized protein n=1 Tax=Dipteronia dyeriana TaxID=168575 RepID=A0AAE0CSQ4_9ROSI|nr:hypothetical protein Ddye_000610 [Dipteronia dyeriana]
MQILNPSSQNNKMQIGIPLLCSKTQTHPFQSYESSDSDTILESYQATQIVPHAGPQIPIQILSEKYSKHVDAIAYIDTGSHNTIMNPKILPSKGLEILCSLLQCSRWTNIHY